MELIPGLLPHQVDNLTIPEMVVALELAAEEHERRPRTPHEQILEEIGAWRAMTPRQRLLTGR